MFIYTNIGNSKFVEMHGDASDIYPLDPVTLTFDLENQ
jgi:hypothetical protein